MKPEPQAPTKSSGRNSLRFVEAVCLRCAALLVPAASRQEWLAEWCAELWHLQHSSAGEQQRRVFDRASLVHGIFADAFGLRLDQLQQLRSAEGKSGSARWCLQMLLALCAFCALAEFWISGSWRGLMSAMDSHFSGCFVYVVLPASFVAFSTSPLRPRKCDRKRSRLAGFLSANTRWNLFLAAKVLLTLIWGFLLSAVITMAAHKTIGHWADWVELLATALTVILSLRWALLNQERRCQHCLRMLSRPTRVGFASRNFLDWNGTELICADGHGLLHVTEMQGSWCWYDLWVELDPTWHGLFSA